MSMLTKFGAVLLSQFEPMGDDHNEKEAGGRRLVFPGYCNMSTGGGDETPVTLPLSSVVRRNEYI